MSNLRFFSILALLLGFACAAPAEKIEAPKDKDVLPKWSLFLRPAKSNPADQLAYAQNLEEAGRRKAAKQYKALVKTWPESNEAPAAQLAYARILDHRGKPQKSFDAYQKLMEKYTGRFEDYEEVLQRQFDIAVELMQTKKGKFLFIPGFYAPERSIPLFEKVIENGPQWSGAPEAQYLIGRAYEKQLKYEEAIRAYDTVQNRYPDSSFAETAAYRGAYCLFLIAEENPTSEADQYQAYAAMTHFVQHFPAAEERVLAIEYQRTLLRRLAEASYNKALYYDKIAKKPQAALIAYQQFVAQYPNSEWTDRAETRIESLSQLGSMEP